MALLLLLLLPVLLLLLLLLCCCFVAAATAGAFRSPTVEKPIFAQLLTFQKVFAAYSVVCAAVTVLLLFGSLCFYLYNFLLLVRLVVCVFPVVVAVFFCF